MSRLSKSFGKGHGAKPVLKNINLAFYPGAKIGVLGSNGSGKSTLMKVKMQHACVTDWLSGGALCIPALTYDQT